MKKTYNTFNGGLVLDYHPLSVPNNVLTDALNGTIITMNGNEAILQNDMGNGRVENAFLPPGYVPVGVKEHGGIIYIASYNPLTNKGQLGSFPSPERNIDFKEIDNRDSGVTVTLLNSTQSREFQHFETAEGISGFQDKAQLFEEPIRSGDKFALYFDNTPEANLKYLNFGTNRELVNLYIQVLDANNNLRDITEDLKITDNGYFIGNEPITADDVINERDKSKYLNTYNNKLFGKLFLVGKVNTIEYIEVSTEIEVNSDNELEVKWTVNYYYKCKEDYLDTPIIDYKIGDTGDLTTIDNKEITPSYKRAYNENLSVKVYVARAIISKKTEGYLYFRVIPKMKFPNKEESKLVNIAEEGSINLSLIGTGYIDLNRWNYRYLEDSLTLNYGFEADISGQYTYKNLQFICSLISSPQSESIPITIPDKNSYNGTFEAIVSQLSPGKIYKVQPTIERQNKSGDTVKLNLSKKLIITTNIYNDLFKNIIDYCAQENVMTIYKHNTIRFTIENNVTLEISSKDIKDVPYQNGKPLQRQLPFYSETADTNSYSLKRENIFHFKETIKFKLGLDKNKYPFNEAKITTPSTPRFKIKPSIGTLEESPYSSWDQDTSTYECTGTITIPKEAQFKQSVSKSQYVLNKYENICQNFIKQLNGQCFITPVFAMWEGENEIQINLIKTNTIGENPVYWSSSKQVFVDVNAGHMGTKSLSEFFSFQQALSKTLNKSDAPFIFTSLNNINYQYDKMQTNGAQKDYLKQYTDDLGKDCTRINTSLFNDADIKNEYLTPYDYTYVNKIAKGLTDPKANGTKANYWYYLFIKDTSGNYVILNVCNRTEKVYTSIQDMIQSLLGGLNIYYKTDEPVSKELYKQEITSKEDSSVEELFLENKINNIIRITGIDSYTVDSNDDSITIQDADFKDFLTFPIDTTNIAINSETKNITVEGFDNFDAETPKGIIEDNVVTDNSGNSLTKDFYYYDNEEGVDGKDASKLTDRLTIENGNILVKYNLDAIDTKKTFAVGDKKDGTYHNTSVKVKNKLFRVLFLPDYFQYPFLDSVKPKLEKLVD